MVFYISTKKSNGKGLAVVAVGGTALSFANEGLKARNTNKMGKYHIWMDQLV